jgi:ComF family protein
LHFRQCCRTLDEKLCVPLFPLRLASGSHCFPPATRLYLAQSTSSEPPRRVVFSSSFLSRAQREAPRVLKSAAESLFAVLFPSDCRICLEPLVNVSNLPVCEACLARVVPLEGIVCRLCGEKLFSSYVQTDEGALCGLCRRIAPQYRRAVAFGAYQGELRDLIHLFKYNGIKPAGALLARLLRQAIDGLQLPADVVFIPVPLWPGKRQARGFNQAEAILRAFCSGKASGSIQLDTSSLVRTRETASQTGLTRKQRRLNVRGAFAVPKSEKVRGRSILLVDDVMTTGTTVNECARVLLRAGAKQVFVATVARATREVESVRVVAAAARGGVQGHA